MFVRRQSKVEISHLFCDLAYRSVSDVEWCESGTPTNQEPRLLVRLCQFLHRGRVSIGVGMTGVAFGWTDCEGETIGAAICGGGGCEWPLDIAGEG